METLKKAPQTKILQFMHFLSIVNVVNFVAKLVRTELIGEKRFFFNLLGAQVIPPSPLQHTPEYLHY